MKILLIKISFNLEIRAILIEHNIFFLKSREEKHKVRDGQHKEDIVTVDKF